MILGSVNFTFQKSWKRLKLLLSLLNSNLIQCYKATSDVFYFSLFGFVNKFLSLYYFNLAFRLFLNSYNSFIRILSSTHLKLSFFPFSSASSLKNLFNSTPSHKLLHPLQILRYPFSSHNPVSPITSTTFCLFPPLVTLFPFLLLGPAKKSFLPTFILFLLLAQPFFSFPILIVLLLLFTHP